MIKTRELTKNFEDFTAVKDLDLDVNGGEILALLGPNGAGKTTTVRMLTSVLRPTSGQAWINGYDVITQQDKIRNSVGVLTEHHGLYKRMPAVEYLDFFGELYGIQKSDRERRTEKLLHDFELTEVKNKKIGEYSKGMRQKLALARAIYHDPKILLLDEPTSAMDPSSSRLVRNAILSLRKEERAVIICTHNLAEAQELADQIAIIRRGQIVARGTTQELQQKYLGFNEFQITINNADVTKIPDFNSSVKVTEVTEDRLRFITQDAGKDNPKIIARLVNLGFEIVAVQEIPRTLESVYLRVIDSLEEEEKYG
ncbi:MAG: ABC transporter ATP-binding protein [Anaerolineales bacterium]|nr:ABC transporter ATP-binding protein [Anaerolineales bacterium]